VVTDVHQILENLTGGLMNQRFMIAGLFLLLIVQGFATGAETESAGTQLYMEYCSSCHGVRLQGGNAQSLVDGVWQYGAEAGAIRRNIKFGITHIGMPSYEKVLSDGQIEQIIDYLELQEQKAAPSSYPIPKALQTLDYHLDVQVIAEGLEVPWGIAFIDASHILVTERPGRLRVIQDGKLTADPVKGTPKVVNEGQGGLLDVAVDPDYAKNGWVYLAYSHAIQTDGSRKSPAMTRLVRGRIRNHAWVDQQVVFEAPLKTYLTTRHHYGCRIVFDKKGYLYFGIGDRGPMDMAQEINVPNGKIHRIYPDGKIPADNPFVDGKNAIKSIFSYGNRNPQGLAVHPDTDQLWETEHGPLGGDEINLIQAGVNYGWPVISYGRNYNGSIITDLVEKEGMAQPVYYWKPSIAVCGMDFVRGPMFEKWQNHILVTALKYEEVRLLDVKNNRVMHDEIILKNAGRVRDVGCAPDGSIYILLNEPGTVLRLTSKK
jgi:glucose/arabinose dehydrogenase